MVAGVSKKIKKERKRVLEKRLALVFQFPFSIGNICIQVSTIKTEELKKKITDNIHLKKNKENNPQACFTLSSHRQASSKNQVAQNRYCFTNEGDMRKRKEVKN